GLLEWGPLKSVFGATMGRYGLHLIFLFFVRHHLHAHYMDFALIGINVGVQNHVVAFMTLHGFRVHDLPTLLVLVSSERTTVIADGALDVFRLGRFLFLIAGAHLAATHAPAA